MNISLEFKTVLENITQPFLKSLKIRFFFRHKYILFINAKLEFSNVYFLLRFGFANAINYYLRLKILVIENFQTLMLIN